MRAKRESGSTDSINSLRLINEASFASYPQTFAGLFVDHDRGGLAILQFTDRAEESAAAVASGRLNSGEMEARTVRWSFRDLFELSHEIVDRRGHLEREFGPIDVGVDTRLNAVVIEVSPLNAEVDQRLREEFGPDVHIVERQHPVRTAEDACIISDCDPPLRGALQAVNDSRGLIASFGFMARNSSGTRYALAAGHHGLVGNEISHAGVVVGGVPASVDSGNVDAARVFVNDFTFWNPVRWVYHNAGAQAFSITSRNATATNAFTGLMLCRSGQSYQGSCGVVARVFHSPSSLSNNTNLLEVEDACAEAGDSGGPYYTRVTNNGVPQGRAFGLHVASSSSAECLVDDELIYASHLQYVQTSLNVTVIII